MYAIPWRGAVMVPINTRLAAPEIQYIQNDSGAVALFVDTGMSHHLTALDGKTPSVREVVWLDDFASPDARRSRQPLLHRRHDRPGKVLKRELREPYWKGFTKAVN